MVEFSFFSFFIRYSVFTFEMLSLSPLPLLSPSPSLCLHKGALPPDHPLHPIALAFAYIGKTCPPCTITLFSH